MNPWLTVVMPIHAGELLLPFTLDSMVAECDEGVEILFIDSSPDERCLAIGQRYTDRLNIRLMHRRHVKPWTDKTNLGVAEARAEHVVMLHQDDMWLPDRVQNLRRWIEAAPNAALQLAPTAIIREDGCRVGIWRCPLKAGPISPDIFGQRLIVQNFISVPAPLFRRDAFLAVGGMDSALWYTADWDLWLKLGQHGPVVYNPHINTAFRVHGKSLTMSGSRDHASFVDQMKTVVTRHAQISGYDSHAGTRAMADASIKINASLAGIAAGQTKGLGATICSFLALGPVNILRYLRYSRLLERIMPRLKAGLF